MLFYCSPYARGGKRAGAIDGTEILVLPLYKNTPDIIFDARDAHAGIAVGYGRAAALAMIAERAKQRADAADNRHARNTATRDSRRVSLCRCCTLMPMTTSLITKQSLKSANLYIKILRVIIVLIAYEREMMPTRQADRTFYRAHQLRHFISSSCMLGVNAACR